MEESNLDLSHLTISTQNVDSEPGSEMKQEEKKIIRFALPEEPLVDAEKKLAILIAYFSDGTNDEVVVSFNFYFKWLNKKWNHPDYAKLADVVTMKNRMEDAAPYNVFFSTLKHCPETKDQLYSVTFTDLLCPSFGKLKSSFHITFMADIGWILTQFAQRNLHKVPMTIIHGYAGFAWPEKEIMEKLYPNIDYHFIQNETDLGCHHTKLSIFVYEDDSLRLTIGSANLYANDWEIYNQEIWISPRCPKLPEGSPYTSGISPTGFKLALLDYLSVYDKFNIPSMKDWVERVKYADFSEIKVALVFTVPGVHYPRKNGSLLHFLGHLLTRDCTIPAPKEEHDSWRIIAQTSALGLIGRSPDIYLTTHFLKSLGSHKDIPYLPTFPSVSKAKFSLIFPTVKNAREGYLGLRSAACCPYEKGVKEMQPWLLNYSCQWKADGTKRTRAMSHSKCYCRISPCWEKMAYYFLTSSNFSRSAWGAIPNRDSGIFVRSFEMGVLFLPKFFGEEYFEVKDSPNRKNKKLFPIMFDLPLVPYGPDDDSFCWDEFSPAELGDVTDSEEEDSNSETDNTKEKTVKSSETGDSKKNNDTPSAQFKKTDNETKKKSRPRWTCKSETPNRDGQANVKPEINLFYPSFSKKS